MKFSEFKKSLSSPHPVYVLISSQEFFRRQVYRLCRDQVDKLARDFDWSVFDLEEHPLVEVINTARTHPWISQRRWIYVRNPRGSSKGLREYLEKPALRTVMVLECSKRSSVWTKFPCIDFKEDDSPIRWIQSWAKKENYVFEEAAARAMVELVGEDLGRLKIEFEKQLLAHWKTRKITLKSVSEITLESREYDVFNLIGAMAKRKPSTALRILNRLFEKGTVPSQILSMLYWTFRRLLVARQMLDEGRTFREVLVTLKIWSYRGREREVHSYSSEWLEYVLIQIRQTDRLCKGGVSEPKFHLERLLIDTCQR